ncbi:hypothetical protein DFH27DRAFT_315664 [Peziza echinospora]|nr:hypothetical protein DFH27DRAFT_315664 [Peziza echinospora]
MGLFSKKKERDGTLLPEHKFDYINLADFHSNSFLAGFAYATIFVSIIISLGGYAADVYTAVNLLILNKWSSKLAPVVEFKISKWIFAGCIILSFVLLAFEWAIAIRVLRGNGVADTYLDSIAQRWTCVFGGRGRKEDSGWKRFLVFARLTKSKSGVDYVALFTYFSFKGWLRTIFAEGPRQAINAITLYSVMKIPKKVNKGEELSAILKFFENFGDLAKENRSQAIILGAMCFTLIIWVFAMLQLLIAAILYVIYLCHVVGSNASLRDYCKIRVDEKLSEIVRENHRKELERQRDQKKGTKSKNANATPALLNRQPTVPILSINDNSDEKPPMPKITAPPTDKNGNRIPTLPTLASLEKPKPTASINSNQSRPYGPNRTGTNDSRKNLLSDPQTMGYGGRGLERNDSSSQASVYTQSSRGGGGYDSYGVEPIPSMGRPTPTPSRQQNRGPPQFTDIIQQVRTQNQQNQQSRGSPSFADVVGQVRSPTVPYAQQQRQQNRPQLRQAPRSDYDTGDVISEYSSYTTTYTQSSYTADQYSQVGYTENDMYSTLAPPQFLNSGRNTVDSNTGTINVTMAAEFEEYPTGTDYNSQFNPAIPPAASSYPPLSRAFADARSSDGSSLSRGPSSGSRSNHSQGRKLYLNDLELESEGRFMDLGTEEIEMTPQIPLSGDEGWDPINAAPAASGYTAYQPSTTIVPSRSLTTTLPPRSATAAPQSNPPMDYFGEANTPRRVGTAPIAASNRTRSPPSALPLNPSPSSSASQASSPRKTPTPVRSSPGVPDYFGAKNTPQRVGTAPLPSRPSPRDNNRFEPPPRSYTAAPEGRNGGGGSSSSQQSPTSGLRRAETAPNNQQEEEQLPYKPRNGYGGDIV